MKESEVALAERLPSEDRPREEGRLREHDEEEPGEKGAARSEGPVPRHRGTG